MSDTTTAWENSQPPEKPNPIDPNERFYGSLVLALVLIFLTVLNAVMFMRGFSPGWGWVVVGGCVVGAYRVWLL
jgi:hypothetical protein